MTAHLDSTAAPPTSNPVDGEAAPTFHFDVVREWSRWEALGRRLRAHGLDFIIEPYVRFQGEVGEQGTFFIKEPSRSGIEFKSFKDMGQLFAA